jgi:rhamnulose-1-phosphate aldolase
MKSILDNRPELIKTVNEIAEVAGFLWQKGWAERNGGNITINVTEFVDEKIRSLPAISEKTYIGKALYNLKNAYFLCKGTNKRMRDVARYPMENICLIRITDDSEYYEIIADKPITPTSELASHLSIHNYLIGKGSNYKAVLHTHPTDLVAMTHNPVFLGKDKLTYLLWSMIPETRAFCPRGLGIIPYCLPSSFELANATLKELEEYDVVMWEKHGVISVSENLSEAFDMVDTLSKAAQIFLMAKTMGFQPSGLTVEQMEELKMSFKLPK